MKLDGRIAVVTGGTSGIGLACAEALAGEGCAVIAFGRRAPAGPLKVPAAGAVVQAQLDVTDEAAVTARFAEIATFELGSGASGSSGSTSAVDILVCAAGTGTFAPFATASAADLRAMLDVHVVGAFLPARAVLAGMIARRRGHVVAIGSHVAHRAFPTCSGYTAAKAGQLGLLRVLAEEARPHGVRVTNVLAGATDTPIWDDRPDFDRTKMMRPADVASFVVTLVTHPEIAVDEVTVMPPAGAL